METKTIYSEKDSCTGSMAMQKGQEIYAGIKKGGTGYIFRFSDCQYYKILYTISGNALIKCGAREYGVSPGTICFFGPNEDVTIENDSAAVWEHIYIYLRSFEAPFEFNRIYSIGGRVLQVSNSNEMQQLFEHIVYDNERQDKGNYTICDSYLRIILHKITSQIVDEQKGPDAVSYTSYVHCRNFIDENFSKIISLEDVADRCHINKIYLCRLFRRYAGITPMAYLTQLKMNKATTFLRHTDYSIKQISIILNFDDPCHFSRRFKEKIGLSPKNYRLNWQGKIGN